jgi:ABC-2 type transport system ATP-binding protein
LILSVKDVSKAFGNTQALQHVSLDIERGSISGFLGPNGAGKTTLIRMIMDIYKVDEGKIELASELTGAMRHNVIGYLPEERGLYMNTKVRDTLIYFAELKGLDKKQARESTDHFLERLGMQGHARKRIKELSKGNQQKIQFIGAVVARPVLTILDEPFSGLDPINTKLLSQLIRELRDEGMTFVLSTHQMQAAETFCDHIFLFNLGNLILEGPLQNIIASYSGRDIILNTKEPLPACLLFESIEVNGEEQRIRLQPGVDLQQLYLYLGELEQRVEAVKPFRTPLSEIFIDQVSRHQASGVTAHE